MSLTFEFQIQEGLSPNHLKKAKLMFFYSRYPSSNMLKMFFSDVKVSSPLTVNYVVWKSAVPLVQMGPKQTAGSPPLHPPIKITGLNLREENNTA